MTSGQGAGPDPPPDHARAETYLRLLAGAAARSLQPDEPPRGMRVVVGLLGDDAPDAPDWARAVRVPA